MYGVGASCDTCFDFATPLKLMAHANLPSHLSAGVEAGSAILAGDRWSQCQ